MRTYIYCESFYLPLFGFSFPPHHFFLNFFTTFHLVYSDFFLVGYILTFFYFLFASESDFCSMILVNTHLRTWMIGTNLGFLLALVEFKRQLFSCLDNLMGLNYIGEGMGKGKKDGED